MSDLHIKNDKQLRDAARVWKKMGLADVTVYLDGGDANNEFAISQKTIETINDINAATAGGPKSFKVKPCNVDGEECAIRLSSLAQAISRLFRTLPSSKQAIMALDTTEISRLMWYLMLVRLHGSGMCRLRLQALRYNFRCKSLYQQGYNAERC